MVHFRFGRIRLPDRCESAFKVVRNKKIENFNSW